MDIELKDEEKLIDICKFRKINVYSRISQSDCSLFLSSEPLVSVS